MTTPIRRQFYVQHEGGDLIGPFESREDADDYRHSRHATAASALSRSPEWWPVREAFTPQQAAETVNRETAYGGVDVVRLPGSQENDDYPLATARKERLKREREQRAAEKTERERLAAEAERLEQLKREGLERLRRQDRAAEKFAEDNGLDLGDARQMLGLDAAPAGTPTGLPTVLVTTESEGERSW